MSSLAIDKLTNKLNAVIAALQTFGLFKNAA